MSVNKVQNKKYGNQNLSKCIEKMHLGSETADVYFEFNGGDGSVECVPAHKSFLAAVSDVFKAMFYGQLMEKSDVKLTDVTAEALKEFLQFFYMSDVEPTMENITEVIHLEHKYDAANCADVCVRFLKDILTNDHICTGLGLALLYNQDELLKFCEKSIILNTIDVFKSTSFLECDKRILEHILQMNLLSCSEVEVFEACMSWVRAKSGQDLLTKETVETCLGDLFYEIRFSSMTIQEFATLTNSYDSVLSNDFKNITKMIILPEFKPNKFNKEPRQITWNEDAIIQCSRLSMSDYESTFLLSSEENTTFSTNEPLLLGSFICAKIFVETKYGDQELTSNLSIDVEIFETTVPDTELENDAKSLMSFGTSLYSSDTEVLFPKSILIRPGFYYTICMRGFPESYRRLSKLLRTDVQIGSDINIQFHPYSHTTIHGFELGLIPALNFNRI